MSRKNKNRGTKIEDAPTVDMSDDEVLANTPEPSNNEDDIVEEPAIDPTQPVIGELEEVENEVAIISKLPDVPPVTDAEINMIEEITHQPEIDLHEKQYVEMLIEEKLDNPVIIEDVNYVTVTIPVHPLKALIAEYAEKVGPEKATKLAQRLLSVGQTGYYDETTESAYNFIAHKSDFANDYRNQSK